MMKKFRFSTLHFIMIGLILFGIIAVLHSLFPEPSTSLMATFVAFLILVLLFIYQKKSYEISELEQIEYLNEEANSGLMQLLDQMPVGVIKIRKEDNHVEWFNPYAELIFSTEDGQFDVEYLQQVLAIPF